LLSDLRHDVIIFDHPGYRKIHGIFNEHYLDKELTEAIDMNVFLTIEDDEIKNCVIDILASPYTLANWEKHSIPVTLEENILKRSAESALYSFKMRRLEMMISENQKQLKEAKSEEDALILIAEQQLLLQAKTIFSAKLGRVVIK
jgi:hypothetical protein